MRWRRTVVVQNGPGLRKRREPRRRVEDARLHGGQQRKAATSCGGSQTEAGPRAARRPPAADVERARTMSLPHSVKLRPRRRAPGLREGGSGERGEETGGSAATAEGPERRRRSPVGRRPSTHHLRKKRTTATISPGGASRLPGPQPCLSWRVRFSHDGGPHAPIPLADPGRLCGSRAATPRAPGAAKLTIAVIPKGTPTSSGSPSLRTLKARREPHVGSLW